MASIPVVGKSVERVGEAPELTIPAERFVTVRLEGNVLVTEDSCEFLSTPRRELICIE